MFDGSDGANPGAHEAMPTPVLFRTTGEAPFKVAWIAKDREVIDAMVKRLPKRRVSRVWKKTTEALRIYKIWK